MSVFGFMIAAVGCHPTPDTGTLRSDIMVSPDDGWVSWENNCGSRTDGDVYCQNDGGGTYRVLSFAGYSGQYSCGAFSGCCQIRPDGVWCDYYQDELSERVAQVRVWGSYDLVGMNSWVCATREAAVECALVDSDEPSFHLGTVPSPIRSISSADDVRAVCVVDEEDDVYCWPDLYSPKMLKMPLQGFEVHAGSVAACAVSVDGWVTCAPYDSGHATETPVPPAYPVRGVSVGVHGCSLDAIGGAECWSNPQTHGEYWNYEAPFRNDTAISCWTYDECKRHLFPPSNMRFTSVHATWGSSCGVREDGHVVCWGPVGGGPWQALDVE